MPQTTDGQILAFIYEQIAKGSAEIASLGETMETWLIQKGFVLPRDPRGPVNQKMEADWSTFRGRIYNIFGLFVGFGFLIMLYSMFLGSSTGSTAMFLAKFMIGLVVFTAAWLILAHRMFNSLSRALFWGIAAFSVLFALVAVDNYPWSLKADAAGIVHSMAGNVKDGQPLLELEMLARTWTMFGFFVAIVTLIPFMILGSAAQAVVSLIFGAPKKVIEIIVDLASDESSVAQRARIELQKLAEPHLTRMNLWVLALALIALACAVIPTLTGLMFAVAIGMVSIITLSSKKGFGIVGHDLSKWVHAGTIAVVLGSIALYLMYIGFNVYLLGPRVYIPVGILFLILCVMMPILVKNTSLRAERTEKGSGDTDVEDYKIRVVGINPDGTFRKEIVHPEKRNWFGWLHSGKLWAAVGVIALITTWDRIGRPNPFGGFRMNITNTMIMGFFLLAALLLLKDKDRGSSKGGH
jgi:hypothetical protein